MTLGLGSYSYHHCFELAGQRDLPARFDMPKVGMWTVAGSDGEFAAALDFRLLNARL